MLESRFPIILHTGFSKMAKKSVVIPILLLLGACGFSGASVTRDEMNIHAAKLTKLSAAVEAHVRYGNPAPGTSEKDLLKAATEDQPQLLSDFSAFKLRVLNQDRHAAVLVCDKDGKRALLEDAGCTGKLEFRHWETNAVPCSFTVSMQEVCGSR